MRYAGYILFAVLVSAAAHSGETLDRIVATVDRHPITRSDVELEARFTHLTAGEAGQVTVQDEIAALERRVIEVALVEARAADRGAAEGERAVGLRIGVRVRRPGERAR